MKSNTTSYSTSIIVMLVLVMTSMAMAQSPFIGTWVVDKNKTIEIMDDQSKIEYDSLDSSIQERAKASLSGRTFSFKTDNTVDIEWKVRDTPRSATGTWHVDDVAKIITITVDNRSVNYDYQFISTASLTLTGKQRQGFFNNIYLIKSN